MSPRKFPNFSYTKVSQKSIVCEKLLFCCLLGLSEEVRFPCDSGGACPVLVLYASTGSISLNFRGKLECLMSIYFGESILARSRVCSESAICPWIRVPSSLLSSKSRGLCLTSFWWHFHLKHPKWQGRTLTLFYVKNVKEGKGIFRKAGVSVMCLEEMTEFIQLGFIPFLKDRRFYNAPSISFSSHQNCRDTEVWAKSTMQVDKSELEVKFLCNCCSSKGWGGLWLCLPSSGCSWWC